MMMMMTFLLSCNIVDQTGCFPTITINGVFFITFLFQDFDGIKPKNCQIWPRWRYVCTYVCTYVCVACVRHCLPNGAGLDLRGLLCFTITWTDCLRSADTNAHTVSHQGMVRASIISCLRCVSVEGSFSLSLSYDTLRKTNISYTKCVIT